MKIDNIQIYSLTKPNQKLTLYKKNNVSIAELGLNKDIFVSSKKQPEIITFTGAPSYEKFLRRYLETKSCKVSMRASKCLYLDLKTELKGITEAVQVPVSPSESILAWDINPKNSKKYVIYLHGFSQNITNNQPLYKALSNTDFGVLAIEYRGYGKNPKSKNVSDKDIVQDIKSAVEYLQNKGVKDVGLIGHSFGGYVATKASNSNRFGFQILVAPMLSLEFWLKKVLKFPKRYKTETKLIKYLPKYSKQYSKVFDIKKQIVHNTTPTFIVQSRHDAYVRASKVKDFSKQIPDLKKYVEIKNGGHRMDNEKISSIVSILKNL
jgi:esterase/lipase